MKCKITSFVKFESDNKLPYFVIKAIGIRTESDLIVDEDDYRYGYASFSDELPPMFEKKIFASTSLHAEALEKIYMAFKDRKVAGLPTFIRLMVYEWTAPFPFYIVQSNSITGVREIIKKEKDWKMKKNKMVLFQETQYIPKVFNTISVTLLETKDGKCAENGGDADDLCRKIFNRAVTSHRILSQESATYIKKVIKIEEIDEPEDNNANDEWKNYYNEEYYNDGVDMDQQDERFWNF